MLQKAYCPGNLGRDRLDLFFSVQGAVNLYTKVLRFFNNLQFIFTNFQFQVFIWTFESSMFLFGANKHDMSFFNIQRKFVALEPSV